MKRRSKFFLVIILMFALVGLTGLSFAYWDSLTATDSDRNVEIGAGMAVTVTSTTNGTGKTLIPNGNVKAANDVYEVTFTYTVSIDKTPASALDLKVSLSNVKIGGLETNASLANFTVGTHDLEAEELTLNDALVSVSNTVEVVITVTLSEPADLSQFNAVKNQEISFDVIFKAQA